jgi:lysozyme
MRFLLIIAAFERRVLRLWQRLMLPYFHVYMVQKRHAGLRRKTRFYWRWARHRLHRFRRIPGWRRAILIALIVAIFAAPYPARYIVRYEQAKVYYSRLYPRFYAFYRKHHIGRDRANYYASYYAQYFADYFVSGDYRVALQYALPEASPDTTSYPPDAPNSPLRMDTRNIALLQRFEGFRNTPYLDAGGKLTIGYGHLIRPDQTYTQLSADEARDLLLADVQVAEAEVKRKVRVKLTQNQYAALVSLVYNIGSGQFERSELLRRLNGGDMAGAADQFLRWSKVRGRELPGLYDRRATERELFLT